MILITPICIITTMTHGTGDQAYTWDMTGGIRAGPITVFPLDITGAGAACIMAGHTAAGVIIPITVHTGAAVTGTDTGTATMMVIMQEAIILTIITAMTGTPDITKVTGLPGVVPRMVIMPAMKEVQGPLATCMRKSILPAGQPGPLKIRTAKPGLQGISGPQTG